MSHRSTTYRVPWAFAAPRHWAVDERNRICAVDCYFAWAGPNHISLVCLVQVFTLLIVLIVREHACKNAVKLGNSREKWTRNLYKRSVRGIPSRFGGTDTNISQTVEERSVNQDACHQDSEVHSCRSRAGLRSSNNAVGSRIVGILGHCQPTKPNCPDT